MSDPVDPTRRAKRFLSAEQKYEIWLRILCGELTTNEAAARAGVDRSTVLKLRKVAKDGAIAALGAEMGLSQTKRSANGVVSRSPPPLRSDCCSRQGRDKVKETSQMFTIVAVAVGIPGLVLLAYLGMRWIQSVPFARSLAPARGGDARGIALQTIIIMVVLLAIAGSVAAVLLNRAGEETARVEDTSVSAAYGAANEQACALAGGTWTAGAAGVPAGDELAAVQRFRPGFSASVGSGGDWCMP